MRTRNTLSAALVLSVLLTGASASTASAVPPPDLGPEFITDLDDALTATEEDALNARLGELADGSGGELYVVIVDAFTTPEDAGEWANTTAEENGLGPDQYLFALAVQDRNYFISADEDGPLSFEQVETIEQEIRPLLREEDWAGAIEKAADEIQDPDTGAAASPFGVNAGVILTGLLFIVAVAVVIWLIVRSRRNRRAVAPSTADPNDPFSSVSDEELTRQAGSALVQADDAITSSKEELGFAIAEFGDASTERFTQTVAEAQAKVSEAFALKQQLDDEVPETDAQRRDMHIRIVQLCDAADALLDDNVEAFDELRKLEQDAPNALERIRTQLAATRTALPQAPPALATLAESYEPAELVTVSDNPAQAEQRLKLAETQVDAAVRALAAGRRGEAAFAIRTAEEAVAQAAQLIQAVMTLGTDLAAAEAQARGLIADLEADLAAATQLPDADGRIAPVLASTRAHLAEAAANLEGTARSPRRMLEQLDAANTQIDAVIAQVRDAQQAELRNRQLLEQRLLQAQAQVAAATEYIATRRGAVGATPRTRLAEAGAALSQAYGLQTSDTAQALQLATRAHQLAQEAISFAETEISSFGTGSLGGGMFGGGSGGLASDILGGVIGGILASGGSSRGSSGGGWRSGGGGGFRTSSFGGSRGGGRSRSGGGRF